jgi:hypothetical protein
VALNTGPPSSEEVCAKSAATPLLPVLRVNFTYSYCKLRNSELHLAARLFTRYLVYMFVHIVPFDA